MTGASVVAVVTVPAVACVGAAAPSRAAGRGGAAGPVASRCAGHHGADPHHQGESGDAAEDGRARRLGPRPARSRMRRGARPAGRPGGPLRGCRAWPRRRAGGRAAEPAGCRAVRRQLRGPGAGGRRTPTAAAGRGRAGPVGSTGPGLNAAARRQLGHRGEHRSAADADLGRPDRCGGRRWRRRSTVAATTVAPAAAATTGPRRRTTRVVPPPALFPIGGKDSQCDSTATQVGPSPAAPATRCSTARLGSTASAPSPSASIAVPSTIRL